MKERINRLAKGIIDSEPVHIVIKPEAINEIIPADGKFKKEIYIECASGMNAKGFIYSTNFRVKVSNLNNSFGGSRNHIVYEVDTSNLVNGDKIEGSFCLVTNAGELTVPYSFCVEKGQTGHMLADLKTPQDFMAIAEKDLDTALRLIQYPEFVEAPFMKDMKTRWLFDALRGHGSRQNNLEEFLVGIGAKQAVNLKVNTKKRNYDNPDGRIEDSIEILADKWGYTYIEFSTDCGFIHLEKKSAAQKDFKDGVYQVEYTIIHERLHQGVNLGRIFIKTAREVFAVPVEVRLGGSGNSKDMHIAELDWSRYWNLRIAWERDGRKNDSRLKSMDDILEQREAVNPDELDLIRIMRAELRTYGRKPEYAEEYLAKCRKNMGFYEKEEPLVYYFYRFVMFHMEDRNHETEAYESAGNTKTVYKLLCEKFHDGARSPLLYLAAIRMINLHPEFMENAGDFERQVLNFAIKKGLLEEKLAIDAAEIFRLSRSKGTLSERNLIKLYEQFGGNEILQSLCSVLIRNNRKGPEYFNYYKLAVVNGLGLTRLYEYFLYSLPENYEELVPGEVLLYFSYTTSLDDDSASKLYENIIRFAPENSENFRLFERNMEKFAEEQLFAGKINKRLAVIYRRMIYGDLIDGPIAKRLPIICKSRLIKVDNKNFNNIIVRRDNGLTEDKYPIADGEVCVPVYSDYDLILFEDAGGNRYVNVEYESIPLMKDTTDLLECCFEIIPDHPALYTAACMNALKKPLTADETILLEKADARNDIHPLLRDKIHRALLAYYLGQTEKFDSTSSNMRYILCIDKSTLTSEERSKVCELMIENGYLHESFELIKKYGFSGIDKKQLGKLCSGMILKQFFGEDQTLLFIAHDVFVNNASDSVILDYLCEHFNGTNEEMYRVLITAVREHIDTYDLEERLTAQMLFTGKADRLDRVFELYAERKSTSENIVRAYFTVKSAAYFLDGERVDDRVFAYLEGAVNSSTEREKVPDIYLLALTKYYSTLNELTEDQLNLCQNVIDILIEAGLQFAYFKDLARFIKVSGEILDKEIIEYHGSKERRPYLNVRILPEEEEFRPVEMKLVYRGIYSCEIVLFEGEIIEYEIEVDTEDGRCKVAEGSIVCRDSASRAVGTRFACLNDMSLSLEVKNSQALKKQLEDYSRKSIAVANLFGIK